VNFAYTQRVSTKTERKCRMRLLDGKTSLGGKKWKLKSFEENIVSRIQQTFNVPEVVARILSARGIPFEETEAFLHPSLRQNLPDPYILKDVEKASRRIIQSIENNETIGIMGDYDVDGATSSSLLKLFLEAVGVKTRVFIPDRADGYGPNIREMQKYYDDGIKLVVTVDCGMTAFEPIAFGTKLGLDIVILDHHEPEKHLPDAYAVVNPKRLDEPHNGPCYSMAAVGVVFLTIVAINRLLREQGFYQTRKEPDLKKWLDLVAFGTVCDVVPLRGINRLFVKSGVGQMAKRENIGLNALSEVARIFEKIGSYQMGFILGPRVNAGGRVGTSDLGMRLLSTKDMLEAHRIATELEELNVHRREIETTVLEEATVQAEKLVKEGHPFLLVQGKDWHQGVVGIVAGRLKDTYHLPTFVLSVENDEVKGSSRSVPGVDLGVIVITALQKGILTKGGGHPMAAGFSLKKERIDDFFNFLDDYIRNHTQPDEEAIHTLEIDSILNVDAVNVDLYEKLQVLEPYGEDNPEPCFAFPDVKIAKTILTKNGHIICKLVSTSGKYLDAVAFRAENTPMGQKLLGKKDVTESFYIAGTLKLDTWNGNNKLQIFIRDMACV